MMDETLAISVTPEQYAKIQKSEAVVVCHYRGPYGRFARLDFIGSLKECEVVADTPEIVVMPVGVECEGRVVVKCEDLLQPVEQ